MLRFTLLLFAVLALAACDSSDPELVPVEGNYTAEWTEDGTRFIISLELAPEDGELTGTSRLVQIRDPFSSGAALLPLEGSYGEGDIVFETGLLSFTGIITEHGSAFSGAIAGGVPPYLGGPSAVNADVTFTRTD